MGKPQVSTQEKCYIPWKTGGGGKGRLQELDRNIQLIHPFLKKQALSVGAVMLHMLKDTHTILGDSPWSWVQFTLWQLR